jgi:hypothetical protein
MDCRKQNNLLFGLYYIVSRYNSFLSATHLHKQGVFYKVCVFVSPRINEPYASDFEIEDSFMLRLARTEQYRLCPLGDALRPPE